MHQKVVLLKTHMLSQGGLEKYTHRLVEAFQKRNVDVTLFTSHPFSSPNIKVVSFKLHSHFRFQKLEAFDRACFAYIKREKPSIIFGLERTRFQTHIRAGNGVHAAYLNMRLSIEGSSKKLYFALSPLHRKILDIEKQSFENPNLKRIFCNSHMVKAEILQNYRVKPDKIEVIHNGVEWYEFTEAFSNWEEKKKELLAKWNLPHSFHFLFIGHNYARKGLKLLLFALSKLKEDFHLSVIGKDKNQLYFQKLAQKYRLDQKVTFFGPQKEVIPFYQYADALVIPSYYDPFANVTVEALAMGLNVISSKQNGGSEILNKSQVIEDLKEIDSFSSLLQKALKTPKTSKSSLSIRSGAKKYDFSKKLNQMVDHTLDVT